MIKGLEIQLAGRFRFEVSDGQGSYKDHGWSENMILDSGIQALLEDNNNVERYISVGTGTVPPTPGDTTLGALVATTVRSATINSGYDAAGGYGWTRRSVQFDQGEASGNLTEVAAGASSRGDSLFSRSLIRDDLGQPATITVQAHEFLTVTYEVRRWWITPAPYQLSYMDGGTTKTTTIIHGQPTYLNAARGASAGLNGSKFRLGGRVPNYETPSNGSFDFEVVFGLADQNPAIISLSTTVAGGVVPEIQDFITFDPPIEKSDQYEVTLYGTVSVSRRS